MIIEIPNIGKLEVNPNNKEGTPSFHIKFNGETIVHAEMDLIQEQMVVYVWPEESFSSEERMNDFRIFNYSPDFAKEES